MGPQILLTIVFTVLALPDSARAQMTCTTSVLDLTVRQVILNLHNDLRKRVAIGVARPAPSGRNIYALTYNCSLEESAQRAAAKCSTLNSSPSDRPNIGENVYVYNGPAVKVAAFKHAIVTWRNPAGWNSGNVFTTAMSATGLRNFAQMAWGSTTLIGCGYQHCTSFQSVVCHYLTEGAKVDQVAYQFGQGCTRDQDCTAFASSTCDRGLRLCRAPAGVSLPPTGGSVVSPTQSTECEGSLLSVGIRNSILNQHNTLRSQVAKMIRTPGHTHKRGTDRMFALRYSCALEATASRLADRCPAAPPVGDDEHPPEPVVPTRGQNLYHGDAAVPPGASVVAAIAKWKKEGETFEDGVKLGMGHNLLAQVGQFAQMINPRTYEIGCGYARCQANTIVLCMYRYARTNDGFLYKPITTVTGCTLAGCQATFANATCNSTSGLCRIP